MKIPAALLFLFSIVLNETRAQEDDYAGTTTLHHENLVYRDDIFSLECFVKNNRLSNPAILLNSGERVEVHFDQLTEQFSEFSFYALHCDAHWNPTTLEPVEYIQGFPEQDITTFEGSFNTVNYYVHYQFEFPNDMMLAKLSGNYLLVVFEDGDRSKVVLSQRVLIYETLVLLETQVGQSGTVANRYSHHEIDFNILHPGYSIVDAQRDLDIVLLQNFDWNTALQNLKPQFVKNEEITYDLFEGNEFEAGNEYREFDTRDLKYITMEVNSIDETVAGITVKLLPDLVHAGKKYLANRDFNGKYIVENKYVGDSDLEAEYHDVNFILSTSEFPVGQVYVVGNFSQGRCLKKFRMNWNKEKHQYELNALLKQGYYNYRYVMLDSYHRNGTTEYTEGNYSQTENDYCVIVYHFDQSVGYDRVIGFRALNTAGGM